MSMLVVACVLASASALRLGPAMRAPPSRAEAPRMAEAKDMSTFLAGTSAGDAEEWDEAWGTDSFADLELKGVWERTGKGKKRWAPGDTTGDATVDASLLYSTWSACVERAGLGGARAHFPGLPGLTLKAPGCAAHGP